MKQHEIFIKTLNGDAVIWIEKLRQVLLIQDKGKGTVKNYAAEMILLFKYYNSKTVATITQEEIQQYIVFIKTVHKVGHAKCRSIASACAFFYKQVIKMPYVLPSALYPQKQFILLEYHESARSKATICCTAYFKRILCNRFAVWERPAHQRSNCVVHPGY